MAQLAFPLLLLAAQGHHDRQQRSGRWVENHRASPGTEIINYDYCDLKYYVEMWRIKFAEIIHVFDTELRIMNTHPLSSQYTG